MFNVQCLMCDKINQRPTYKSYEGVFIIILGFIVFQLVFFFPVTTALETGMMNNTAFGEWSYISAILRVKLTFFFVLKNRLRTFNIRISQYIFF